MKICIVVSKYYLFAFANMLDLTKFETVAIVTDDRTEVEQTVYPNSKIFAFWQIKEVVQRLEPDMILFLLPFREPMSFFVRTLRSINYSLDKICDLSCYSVVASQELAANLNKIRKNPTAYKIFSTGISYSRTGIHPESFDLPLISLAFASQDIYYDYQIAKKILLPPPPVKNNFKYALIGLAPYTLHYDLSRCRVESYFLSKYFFALKDLHNYWLDYDTVRNFLKPEFLSTAEKIISETTDFNYNLPTRTIDLSNAVEALNEIETWSRKSYPETVAENKQVLENYLSLLEKFHVKPILFLPPMVKEYQEGFCREKLNELSAYLNELIKRHAFIFINGWAMNGFNDHDFRDINHLNLSGAKKFSKQINEIIMSMERTKGDH